MARYNALNAAGTGQTNGAVSTNILAWNVTAANNQAVWPPPTTTKIAYYLTTYCVGIEFSTGKARALNGSAVAIYDRTAGTMSLTWQTGSDDILTPDATLIGSSIEIVNDYPNIRLVCTGIASHVIDWDAYWTVRSTSFF